jgi:putative tricarboxylic transport membrane protein
MAGRWTGNRLVALILFAYGLWYVYAAFQIPSYSIPRPVDSDVFPKILGFSLLVLSVLLFFEKGKTDGKKEVTELKETEKLKEAKEAMESEEHSDLIEKKGDEQVARTVEDAKDGDNQEQEAVQKGKGPAVQVIVTVVSVALYIALFEVLGFVLCSFAFAFGMTYYFGFKRHLINGIVSLSVSLSFYVLLTTGLGVHLPQGLLPV